MAFRILVDEHVELAVVTSLEKLGHDVDRVVEMQELGVGTNDADIGAYEGRSSSQGPSAP